MMDALSITRRHAIVAGISGLTPTLASAFAERAFKNIQDAAQAEIPGSETLIYCNVGRSGSLHLPFVADANVNAKFVSAHPEVSFVSRDGRGFRLDSRSISVEAFGAIGDGHSNDQPAIQAAIRFAEAVGYQTVSFLKAQYAVYCPERLLPTSANGPQGHSIVVKRQITLQGSSIGGTTIHYRNFDGRSLETSWQVIDGKVWRGAGVFLQGLTERPAEESELPSVSLIDMTLNGGCDRTSYYGYPARLSDGDGWDVTHKGLWAQNDRITGDWKLVRSKIIRFRGELFYQGGLDHGAFIGRDIVMGQTNADILNPCGTNLDIVGGYFYDGNSGWEGWGGRKGQLIRCHFKGCRSMGGIQGGRTDTGAHYFAPRRFQDGVDPWLSLDVSIVDCGQVSIGNWVRGKISMVDSFLYLSTSVFPTLHDVDLDVTAMADSKSLGAAVALTGGAMAGSQPLGRINIRLSIGSTIHAKKLGFSYRQPVAWGGSLGPGISFNISTEGPFRPSGATFKSLDIAPTITTREVR